MAYSKVAYDGHTLIDLTQDTAVESDVADGKYFHKSNGERVQGTSGKVIVQGSDSSAFLIRPTAGETLAPLDCDRKSVLKKLGNTVCVNQLAQVSDFAYSGTRVGVTVTSNSSTGEVTTSGTAAGYPFYPVAQNISRFVVGHKYLQYYKVTNPSGINLAFRVITSDRSEYHEGSYIIFTAGSATYNIEATGDKSSGIYDGGKLRDYQVIDLTLWFGSNDRIPSDLLSHPENWGRYYAGSLAYNAGTLVSADGSVLTSIGQNVWDEETELGTFNWDTGELAASTTRYRSKNFCPCIPNTPYYLYAPNGMELLFYDASFNFVKHVYKGAGQTFEPPSNAVYFKLNNTNTPTYGNDITVSLYYSGESGYDQYYPYSVLAEVDTGSEVLRSAGAVADEKTPDGTITRRLGVVDLGTLTWTRETSGTSPTFWATVTGMLGIDAVAMCSKYTYGGSEGWSTVINGNYEKEIVTSQTTSTPYVMIQDSAYSDAATFKAAMSGVYLYYELATPTTEQGTAFTGLQKVDGHGIEMVTGGTTGIPVPFTAQYLKTINAAPTDTIVITENGSHDVAMYAGAIVDVSGGGTPSLQSKTVNLDSNAPSTVYPGTGYNGLSSVAFNTAGINAANIKAGTSVCGVQGSYKGAAFNHSVGINIDVADGTYQLSLALNYRTKDSIDVKWATMAPEEHEEDGYYTYTANVNLCTGSAMDGFFLTESSGHNLDSGYMAGKTYIEVYHSGNTRTWYFFVPSDASTYNISFTP